MKSEKELRENIEQILGKRVSAIKNKMREYPPKVVGRNIAFASEEIEDFRRAEKFANLAGVDIRSYSQEVEDALEPYYRHSR